MNGGTHAASFHRFAERNTRDFAAGNGELETARHWVHPTLFICAHETYLELRFRFLKLDLVAGPWAGRTGRPPTARPSDGLM